jgi:flagellin-specific chaperone FliS
MIRKNKRNFKHNKILVQLFPIMNEKIANARLKENVETVKQLLNDFSQKSNNSAIDTEHLLVAIEKLYRALSVNKFLLENKEVSSDLNVHLKIMDVVAKQEEAKIEVVPTPKNDTIIEEPVIVKIEPIVEVKPEPISVKIEPLVEQKKEAIVEKEASIEEITAQAITNAKLAKRLEIGINDKFRMINELFAQNNVEYTTAIEQLNVCMSLEESEDYLNNLKALYSWKSDAPIVKTIYALNQKRFA